jgi:hypothetical protein
LNLALDFGRGLEYFKGMKIYKVVMRNSTVVNVSSVSACNAKRARKYIKKIYADDPGYSIYEMFRIF